MTKLGYKMHRGTEALASHTVPLTKIFLEKMKWLNPVYPRVSTAARTFFGKLGGSNIVLFDAAFLRERWLIQLLGASFGRAPSEHRTHILSSPLEIRRMVRSGLIRRIVSFGKQSAVHYLKTNSWTIAFAAINGALMWGTWSSVRFWKTSFSQMALLRSMQQRRIARTAMNMLATILLKDCKREIAALGAAGLVMRTITKSFRVSGLFKGLKSADVTDSTLALGVC